MARSGPQKLFDSYCSLLNVSKIHCDPFEVSRNAQSGFSKACRIHGSGDVSVHPWSTRLHWEHWTLSFKPVK
jgi:hypothetical protein